MLTEMLKMIYNFYIKRAQLKFDIGEYNNMIVENKEKVFTKEKCNNIISKDYNPLNEDYKRFYGREGLFMKETKDVELKEIEKSKELNLKDRIIIKLFPKTFVKVYGIAGKRVFNNIYKL